MDGSNMTKHSRDQKFQPSPNTYVPTKTKNDCSCLIVLETWYNIKCLKFKYQNIFPGPPSNRNIFDKFSSATATIFQNKNLRILSVLK